jgi:beta-xylosidase
MYYSADEHLFAAVADSPIGPFKQVGGYMLETLLGDEKCIDSSRFRDDDGSQYLFFVRFTDGNCIWMCRLEADGITPVAGTLRHCLSVSEPWESKLGRVCEGPFVVKHEGLYYLTYSANDFRSQDYGVGVAVSSSLQDPWTKSASSPILCRADSLLGTGHHSLFTDRAGRPHIVFHAHDSQSSVQPRRMHIGSVEFQGQEIVVRGRSHPAWAKGPALGSNK